MTANFVVNVTGYGYGEGPRLRARHEIRMAHTPQILEGRVGRHERMKGVRVGSSITGHNNQRVFICSTTIID